MNPYRKIRVRPSSGSPEEPNKLYIVVFWYWSGLLGGSWRRALGADLRLVLHLSNPTSGARAAIIDARIGGKGQGSGFTLGVISVWCGLGAACLEAAGDEPLVLISVWCYTFRTLVRRRLVDGCSSVGIRLVCVLW